MRELKTVFMGTPDFAVPCLKVLHEITSIAAVVTQPDRPKGRGQKLTPPPVKQYAEQAGLTVLQPEKIKTPAFTEILRDLRPDLIVVVAFGQILSPEILAIPPLGCVNVHASLLPFYRGAAPIHWSIINGETKTGVTTMFMDAGLDTGDMLLRKEQLISQEMTTGELHDLLMVLGADLLKETIAGIAAGTLSGVTQDHALSTYAPLLTKGTERIDWNMPAEKIHNLIRGLNPWPGAYTLLNGQIVKIWKAKVAQAVAPEAAAGQVLAKTKGGFLIAAGQGSLEILEIQPAGKKKMTAQAYICGKAVSLNDRFE